MLSYPVTVLCLIIIFPLPVAVSQWATLSFGDGFATLVGRFYGTHPLPWNRDQTFEGMGAFLVMGTLGSLFFFLFTLANIHGSSFLWEGSLLLDHIVNFSIPEVIFICTVSTLVAAFFESLPLPYVDDNVVAPIAGALVKLGLCFVI
jgi:dolichol kinase